jgi:hypothetical protein
MRPLQALGASLESICPAGPEAWGRLEAAVLHRQHQVNSALTDALPRPSRPTPDGRDLMLTAR